MKFTVLSTQNCTEQCFSGIDPSHGTIAYYPADSDVPCSILLTPTTLVLLNLRHHMRGVLKLEASLERRFFEFTLPLRCEQLYKYEDVPQHKESNVR